MAFVLSAFSLAISGIAIYAAGFGIFSQNEYVATCLFLSLTISFFLFPLKNHWIAKHKPLRLIIDCGLILIGTVALINFIQVQNETETGFYSLNGFDYWIGLGGILVLLEFARRIWGLPLFIIAAFSIIYLFIGPYLPSIFRHTGFTMEELSESIWYGYSGIFGKVTLIVISVVWVFVVLGNLLEGTGAGKALLNISMFLTSRTRGGPAHAAIVASSLFGTMSGSTVANVVGTGTFTIPLTKERGFKPEFAGGIEATASSGGQIVPPIMGAAAFLMAELTEISYLTIAIAAIVPAFLYYLSLFISVVIEAKKSKIEVDHSRTFDVTRQTMLDAMMFVAPIVVIITVLVMGRSAPNAGFFGIITAFIFGFINPELRKDPLRILRSFKKAGEAGGKLLVAIAAIGIIVGVVNMTGVGLRFANLILGVSENSLFLALFFSMLGALVLGMGMPTLPAYLIIVLIMGPAIENFDIPLLLAHLFIFYYGVASSITPPVALAAYAAAPIAGSKPLATAVTAIRLGFAKFLIPFIFVYYPCIIFSDYFEPLGALLVFPRIIMMIWLVSTSLARFDQKPITISESLIRFVIGIGLLFTNPILHWACFVVGAGLIIHAAGIFSARRPLSS